MSWKCGASETASRCVLSGAGVVLRRALGLAPCSGERRRRRTDIGEALKSAVLLGSTADCWQVREIATSDLRESLSWAESLSAGPLLPSARRFLRWRGAPNVASGPEGIRWLSRELDAFAHDVDAAPSDDERFVEGAGSFLGLLLLERCDGAHREHDGEHRIDLGEHGFFDPFSAIDRVLDAECVATAFGEQLREAEAESASSGPVASVRAAFAQALGFRRPDLAITRRFGLKVWLGEIEVDLGRVALAAAGQPDAVLRDAVERVLSLLPGAPRQERPYGELSPCLRPRLIGSAFLDSLPGEHKLFAHPLTDGVAIAIQEVAERRARYLRSDEVSAMTAEGKQPLIDAVRNVALATAAKFSPVEGTSGDGLILMATTGDGLDAARLLCPGVQDHLLGVFGAEVAVAVPHRDTLLATSVANVHALRTLAEDAYRRAPHSIAQELILLRENGELLCWGSFANVESEEKPQ